jgi:hypothetical protein
MLLIITLELKNMVEKKSNLTTQMNGSMQRKANVVLILSRVDRTFWGA